MGNTLPVSLKCDAIVSRCWDSVFGTKAYVVNLQENLQALTLSLEELRALRNDVNTRVAVAIAGPEQQLKPLEHVQNWISMAQSVETQVNEVVRNGSQEIEKLCCNGYCSNNYLSSYKFGKKVAKKLEEVRDLMSKGVFQEVAAKSLNESIVDEIPTQPTVGMESMFDEVWRHFENEEEGVIGLYGMGGVGKTTLLTKIHNNISRTRNDFNFVEWIVVSKDHKLEILQDKIGGKIGFSSDAWKRKELHEKAQDIFRVLNKKKFVLLLDDIWEPVEIIKLGIPIPDNRNKSKIIFTTRVVDICGHMEAQKSIKVPCMSPDKAWNLFLEKVGKEVMQVHPDIPQLAKIVAAECDGLPLALITIGRAMVSKKTPEEWKYAIRVLQNSASEFSGMGDKVFPLLKFSYDNLPGEKFKSCLLYCALFPEDFLIKRNTLVYFWMCEGILDECENVDEAKNESYHIIGTLLDACLLEGGGDDCVKMHDVVRDMTLWLACDCGKEKTNFLVHTSAERAADVKKWEKTKRVSLMSSHTKRLAEIPRSPNLLTLFIRESQLKMIVGGFFEYMPSLRVLDLSYNEEIAQLPFGISKLVSLQYLNLSNTGITEVPIELKDCVSLKYLGLEWTRNLKFFPPNLISSLNKLKVLRMRRCGNCGDEIIFGNGEIRERWSNSNGNSMMVVIDEIKGLKELEVLSLSIHDISCFRRLLLNYPELVATCIQNLRLDSLVMAHESGRLDVSFLADMGRLNILDIVGIENLKELEVSWGGRGGGAATDNNDDDHIHIHIPRGSSLITTFCFNGLQQVFAYRCPNLMNMTWLIFAPNLSSLCVSLCNEMDKIIDLERLGGVGDEEVRKMPMRDPPFAKLTTLKLHDLPKLTSIYETALPFAYLNKIEVAGCPTLKKLPLNTSTIAPQTCNNLKIQGEKSWWNDLEWDQGQAAAPNVFLPCFRSLPI